MLKKIIFVIYLLFIAFSIVAGFNPGKEIASNFIAFSVEMLKIVPCVFILIGLFEVWVKKETIEKHFGEKSGAEGYLWAIFLSGTTVGGLYVAFPVAYTLFNKGARLSVVFTYISASAICRVPMTVFEASFMGIKFSLIRLFVSLTLVIITSIFLGDYLTRKNYKIVEGK